MSSKQTKPIQLPTIGAHRNRDVHAAKRVITEGRIKRIQVEVTEEYHLRFKMACAKNNTNFTEVILKYVDQWLKENE